MPTPAEFGSWVTDTKTGVAHYVLAGKCLCGTKVKADGPPPTRSAKSLGLVTPLCEECLALNEARWSGRRGGKSEEAHRRRSYWLGRGKRTRD